MFVLGNVLQGLAQALSAALQFYQYVLIAAMVISWVNPDPYNPIVRFLRIATDPPRRAIWRLLPDSLKYFPIDIAFLLLFGLVIFAQHAVVQTLFDFGARLRLSM